MLLSEATTALVLDACAPIGADGGVGSQEANIKARVEMGDTVTDPVLQTSKYRIWVLHCPFKKTGVPVLGTFGSSEKPVVIFELETWKRLCADVPQLQTTQFEVGSYE